MCFLEYRKSYLYIYNFFYIYFIHIYFYVHQYFVYILYARYSHWRCSWIRRSKWEDQRNRVCQFLNTVIPRGEMSSVSLLKHGWEAPDRSATCRFSNNHNCNCALVTVRWVAKPLGVFVVQAEHRNGKLHGNSLGRRKRGKESGLEMEEGT